MRPRPTSVMGVSGLLALLALLAAAAALSAVTPTRTEAQLKALREKIEQMTRQVSRDAVERDRLSTDLRAAELSLSHAREQLGNVSQDYSDHIARRAALAQQRAQQQQALAAERAALAGQLRAAYMIGRQ